MLLCAKGDILFEPKRLNNKSPSLTGAVFQSADLNNSHIDATTAMYTSDRQDL